MLDIPGQKSTETIEIQDKIIKNFETMIGLFEANNKAYDESIYLRDQRILLLQGTLDTLLLARETSFGRGAA